MIFSLTRTSAYLSAWENVCFPSFSFKTDRFAARVCKRHYCVTWWTQNHTWNRKLINSVIFPPRFGNCSLSHRRAPHTHLCWEVFITVRSHRRRRERQSGRKSFIFNVSRRRAPARAARRVLDDESVEESWNQVSFMVMSYDAVRWQPIGMQKSSAWEESRERSLVNFGSDHISSQAF